MNTSPNSRPLRALTLSRILGLVLIGVTVAGLAYLRIGSGDGSVSVPKGARAGQLELHPCRYGTEDGGYAADCGTLVVPENRHKTGSRLIALPVTRIRALSSHPGVPIFRLQGGPGITNMDFTDASRFARNRDVVLVGYRGVDGSSKLDCPEVSSARKHASGFLTEKAYRADAAAFTACARRLTDDGVDLGGYTLPERVDDLDAARRALGYRRVDLISESAGTRTALIYGWRYPSRIHRSVMIGVNPPGRFLWDAKTTGEQVRRYATLCAQDASCRSRTDDLAASLHSAVARMPKHWWFLPIRKGNVEAAAFFGLMNETSEGGGPLSAPKTIDTLLSAQRGEGSGAWFLSLMAKLAFPDAQVWGDVAAVGRSDAAFGRRFFATHADRGWPIGAPGTDLIWAGGRLLDAWPANPDEHQYTRVENSKVPTLLIGGALDFATPPQNATRQLLSHLQNGRQVVLPNLGHTDDFWSYESAASTRLITAYLDSGRVDTSLYTPNHVDFTPSVGHGMIAKIILGVMLGLGTLTVLSLLWLPLRACRRPFGRKASATLRSVYAVLLGIGGWLAATVIILAALPTVALDDMPVAVLAVGLPVGLTVSSASFDRRRSAGTLATGFAVATAGALAGGWLGFHAIEGMLALVTAVAGAVAGANLTVLGLDIVRDRREQARAADASAVLLEAHPSVG